MAGIDSLDLWWAEARKRKGNLSTLAPAIVSLGLFKKMAYRRCRMKKFFPER
jgi:hypothetical protein